MNSLVCLGKILEYLDKWFVIDEILPFLQQIPSREPAVLMGILGKETGHDPFFFLLIRLKQLMIGCLTFPHLTLGIYKCTFSHKKLGIPKEHLASKSLPHLVSLSIDNNLNLNQVLHSQTRMPLNLVYLQICKNCTTTSYFIYLFFCSKHLFNVIAILFLFYLFNVSSHLISSDIFHVAV